MWACLSNKVGSKKNVVLARSPFVLTEHISSIIYIYKVASTCDFSAPINNIYDLFSLFFQ